MSARVEATTRPPLVWAESDIVGALVSGRWTIHTYSMIETVDLVMNGIALVARDIPLAHAQSLAQRLQNALDGAPDHAPAEIRAETNQSAREELEAERAKCLFTWNWRDEKLKCANNICLYHSGKLHGITLSELHAPDWEAARLASLTEGRAEALAELERQCTNCGTTLARCYDVSNPWATPRLIKCCPDCDHRAIAAVREMDRVHLPERVESQFKCGDAVEWFGHPAIIEAVTFRIDWDEPRYEIVIPSDGYQHHYDILGQSLKGASE